MSSLTSLAACWGPEQYTVYHTHKNILLKQLSAGRGRERSRGRLCVIRAGGRRSRLWGKIGVVVWQEGGAGGVDVEGPRRRISNAGRESKWCWHCIRMRKWLSFQGTCVRLCVLPCVIRILLVICVWWPKKKSDTVCLVVWRDTPEFTPALTEQCGCFLRSCWPKARLLVDVLPDIRMHTVILIDRVMLKGMLFATYA